MGGPSPPRSPRGWRRKPSALPPPPDSFPALPWCLSATIAASQVYVGGKGRKAKELGFHSVQHNLPGNTQEADLLQLVERLNGDAAINGILVQLPLPAQIDTAKVIEAIRPDKDVDGFHPVNIGRLATGGSSHGALHAGGMPHSHPPGGRRFVVGPRRRRRRPLEHRRQADGAASPQAKTAR